MMNIDYKVACTHVQIYTLLCVFHFPNTDMDKNEFSHVKIKNFI